MDTELGYGHGYYDKHMTNGKFSKPIGLAYDLQVIKSPIPKFEYDKKIDFYSLRADFIYLIPFDAMLPSKVFFIISPVNFRYR